MSRAVVIGAGLGGVMAAAALSPAVDEVIVLDRDELPDGPEHRRGLPQGRHAHLLMPGGLDAMEELIPKVSIREHLLATGAREISLSSGMVALSPEGWFHRWRHDSHNMITSSRALLDWAVRTAVMKNTGNVGIRTAQVVDLTGDARRVRGVRIGTSAGPDVLDADIVVDASGRGSRILTWLTALGITGIDEIRVDAGLVNATRIYRTPPGAEDFPLTMVQANPYLGESGRSAVIVPIEGNRWMVSLGGTRGGEPPADPDGFLRYTLDLPHPIVGRLLSGAEPLTDVFISHSTSNSRRYVEKARAWPDGLVVLGDALATLNPAYGQGMSVAALGAQALGRQLARTDLSAPGFSRRVQRAAASVVETAWSIAVSQDSMYPGVRGGKRTTVDRIAGRYTRRLTKTATGSYVAASALWDVTGLKSGPARLLHPATVLAALGGPSLPPLSEPPLTPRERELLDSLDTTSGEGAPSSAPV
ncbi:NAD(P)/FAD-dependent oxidoreductase [Streptomyces triticiradicis]|uniref:Pyridine nucleotide-disulfide oxidoreductase n=1 Tax=Streptomyces triticiradicis TaxID=2651189 RepID=A0A7J5DDR7_9ACTN|nr:pyridine nucleotide-disulfide oxidoreductase [Streptomyces triticiradicis]KAB1986066.1 pyridine nucleotide-disulfide oxidoreductase [Streptomyces triticiradicis]